MRCMILTGMPLNSILTMDVLTFNAMLPIVNRVVYREKVEGMWASFYAMNGAMAGEKKPVEAMTKAWLEASGATPEEINAGKKTGKDFIRDFKLGGKKTSVG